MRAFIYFVLVPQSAVTVFYSSLHLFIFYNIRVVIVVVVVVVVGIVYRKYP